MTQQTSVDDRYTNGIWYDASAGDFCKIQGGEDSVELVNPETNVVYHEIPYEDWYGEDFMPVPEEAVADPAAYMKNWVAYMMSNAEMDTGLLFADANTQIVETNDNNYVDGW